MQNTTPNALKARGIDILGKNLENLIHALQAGDIRADQNLGISGTKWVAAISEPSGSEKSSQDGQAETDTGVSLNVTSKPQHEQTSNRVPVTSIDSPQMLEALQPIRETDPLAYLQFLERQAAGERGMPS